MMLLVLLLAWSPPVLQAQDFQPEPVSEYVEKSGPNTLTFLSYPKYYTDSEGQLTLVDTTLTESKNADWDFEVTTGIWTLRVKTDGTFQAEHAGNVFTYKLDRIGVGRGENFSAFEWGEPSWKNYQVIGNTIRWLNVFPDVDLAVRYIHDILKVDVIVKASLMNEIRSEVQKGTFDADDYLTARFSIPNVWITTDVQLGSEKVDIYAGSLDLQQPLEFVKDGKVVQKLRPVEAYVLDEKGEPILSFEEDSMIHTAQVWQLNKESAGIAEMSANLGDLADAPEGDVAIDPGLVFTSGVPSKDSCINNQVPGNNYGSDSSVAWNIGTLIGTFYDYRLLFAFNLSSSSWLYNSVIRSASLEFYAVNQSVSGATAKARVYKVIQDWDESTVKWNFPWSSGGNFEDPKYQGRTLSLPTSSGSWIRIDVTQPLKSHLIDSGDGTNLQNRGFIVRGDTSTTGSYTIAMKEYGTTSLRPRLTIEYGALGYGAHVLPNIASATQEYRIQRVADDKLKIIRYLDEVDEGWLHTFANYAQGKGLKVFIQSPVVRWVAPDNTKINYADHIYALLYDGKDYIDNGTIIGIEIGGEESDLLFPSDKEIWLDPADRNGSGWWFGDRIGGASFAEFYLAARDRIYNSSYATWKNLKIWSGGSPEKHESLTYNANRTATVGSAREFFKGFIARVIESATQAGVGRYDYVPDAIPIHGYVGSYAPEYTVNASWGVTEWFSRVSELYSIFNPYGVIPNFAVTEYGFSAEQGTGFGPSNASAITQAVYYLRSCLMNSTMQPYKGLGFMTNSYFEHNKGSSYGVSFHNNDSGDYEPSPVSYHYGSHRAIKYIARSLFSNAASPALKLHDGGTRVWVPLSSGWDATYKGYAYCGWETNSGTKWGAIWRYDRSTTFTDFATDLRRFWAPQNAGISKVTNRYQFSISADSATLPSPITTDINGGTPSGGKIPFDIPNVDENPVILEFSN